jgi:hypothetical protein
MYSSNSREYFKNCIIDRRSGSVQVGVSSVGSQHVAAAAAAVLCRSEEVTAAMANAGGSSIIHEHFAIVVD